MHVLDPAEVDFPFDEPTLFHGLEDSADVSADPAAVRGAYRAEFDRYLRRLQIGLPRGGDRLCADADRSLAGGDVVGVFGVERVIENHCLARTSTRVESDS